MRRRAGLLGKISLLILDGAPNHRCSDLAVTDNIALLSYLAARSARDAHRGTPIIARHAHSPSTPYAFGVTLRASGVDRSRGPSKKAQHAINAQAYASRLTHNLAVTRRYAP